MLTYHPASKPPRREGTGGFFLSLCCAVITAVNRVATATEVVARTVPAATSAGWSGGAQGRNPAERRPCRGARKTSLLKPAACNGKELGRCRCALL